MIGPTAIFGFYRPLAIFLDPGNYALMLIAGFPLTPYSSLLVSLESPIATYLSICLVGTKLPIKVIPVVKAIWQVCGFLGPLVLVGEKVPRPARMRCNQGGVGLLRAPDFLLPLVHVHPIFANRPSITNRLL